MAAQFITFHRKSTNPRGQPLDKRAALRILWRVVFPDGFGRVGLFGVGFDFNQGLTAGRALAICRNAEASIVDADGSVKRVTTAFINTGEKKWHIPAASLPAPGVVLPVAVGCTRAVPCPRPRPRPVVNSASSEYSQQRTGFREGTGSLIFRTFFPLLSVLPQAKRLPVFCLVCRKPW